MLDDVRKKEAALQGGDDELKKLQIEKHQAEE